METYKSDQTFNEPPRNRNDRDREISRVEMFCKKRILIFENC